MSRLPFTPAELRSVFGDNLKKLANEYSSITDLSRKLGINRTQLNRYLSGDSFPRPDVLAQICSFFEVDARILLEPVHNLKSSDDPINNDYLREFVASGASDVPETYFPSGFYRFSRRSFMRQDSFVLGVIHIHRRGKNTFIRGFESRNAMQVQGLPADAAAREFRGIVMQQEDGLVIIASRRNAMTSSFNYLSRVASFENNYWVGYITRTVPEAVDGHRVTRMVFEHLGKKPADALPTARATGFYTADALPPFHRRLLMPDTPFS